MAIQSRLFGAILAVGLVALPAVAAKEKRIRLRFTPKENVTANLPTLDETTPVAAIAVGPLEDMRQLPDLLQVGENREHEPRPVLATTSVAGFATEVLRKCLGDWGVRLGEGGYLLKGEITNLFVMEEQTYSTQVNVRFTLEAQGGKVLWQGVAVGDAHQFGRSLSEENYNEQISDALKRAYANLLSNVAFRDAWTGRASRARQGAEPQVMSAADVKTAILKMMAQGIEPDTIVQYVRGLKIEPRLSADEIVDWKASGIPEDVLRAALAR